MQVGSVTTIVFRGTSPGFVTVRVKFAVPPVTIVCVAGVLAIAICGCTTVTLAVAEFPFPPFAEVTLPVVLDCKPAEVPITFTEKVHEPLLAARVAPVRLTTPLPAVAVIVPPPHAPLSPFGVATDRPEGRGSEKPTPVSGTVFPVGLVRVKVRVVVAPRAIEASAKDFAMVGGPTRVRVSVASSVFVAPSVSVSLPAGMVLT